MQDAELDDTVVETDIQQPETDKPSLLLDILKVPHKRKSKKHKKRKKRNKGKVSKAKLA